MVKIIIWGILGVFLYLYIRRKLGLDSGEQDKTTIHHHHYSDKNGKKPTRNSDGDYIDYEEVEK